MEMNSGKVLDEACNYFNEVYRDEVLYTSWIENLQVGSGANGFGTVKAGSAGFTPRLYTRNE